MSAYFRRKKMSTFNAENGNEIDYKNVNLLKNYLSETHKMVPRRITGVQTRDQRSLCNAIKLARFVALLPYCDNHK